MAESVWVTLVGIAAGAAGYLFVTFWFQPILKYREIKYRVACELVLYANAIVIQRKTRQNANRRSAAEIEAIYPILPCVYRCYLTHRKEDPMAAATKLIELSNTTNWSDVTRIDKTEEAIRKCLGLPIHPQPT